MLDGRALVSTHDWGYTSAAQMGEPNHALQRGRVIGGCSSHNGCIALWGSRADYDGWAASGNPGWSTDELLPFFRRASATIRVRRFESNEITPFHAACLDAMVHAGIPRVDDLNDLDEDVGANAAPVNIHDDICWNTGARLSRSGARQRTSDSSQRRRYQGLPANRQIAQPTGRLSTAFGSSVAGPAGVANGMEKLSRLVRESVSQ